MPRPEFRDDAHQSACTSEELTAALIAAHEHLLKTPDASVTEQATRSPSDDTPVDAAEFDDLRLCLEQLERARQFDLGGSPDMGRDLMVDLVAMMSSACSPAKLGDGAARNGMESDDSVARIGRFEIIRELGRGGLGVVLLAYDPVLKRQVALKIPNPEGMISPSLRRRFQREGHAAARLLHPHIVPVYEVGDIGPLCFIAAAFVDGPNLAQWLTERKERSSWRLAATLIADLADAMDYAHSQQILHRDLKPSNILLESLCSSADATEPSGDKTLLSAKITDFGLAKLVDQGDDETRHGAVLGTPAYMAPEQARGDNAAIGRASDVYSLGAILYELVGGQTPYVAESATAALAQLLGPDEPLPLRRINPAVPRDLEAICQRCLEKCPAARYATAGELAAELRRFLAGEPTLARPLSVGQRVARWSRRKPALAALVAVSLMAVLALAIGSGFYARDLNRALTLAQENALRAEGNRQKSLHHEARATEQLYVANMRLADLALQEGDPYRARTLLDTYLDGTKQASLRGIEWYVLWSQLLRMENQGEHSSTTVLEHATPMYTAVALQDSRYVVTGGQDGWLRIWEHQRKRLLHEVRAHDSCVNQIRLSPDGRMLGTASCDRTASIWRLSDDHRPELVRTIRHEQPVRRVVWSVDGLLLATTTSVDDYQVLVNQLQVWNVASGERLYNGPCQAAMGLFWSPDGESLIAAGHGEVKTLQMSTWTSHSSHFSKTSGIAALHPDGMLAMPDARNGLREFDPRTGSDRLLSRIQRVGISAWHPEGNLLAVLGGDAMVRVYSRKEAYHEESFCQLNVGSQMGELAFSGDGRYLISADYEGHVCVTELNAVLSLKPSSIQRHSLDTALTPEYIEPDGSYVTLSSADGASYRFAVDWEQSLAGDNRCAGVPSPLRRLPSREFVASFGSRRLEQAEDRSYTLYHVDDERVEPLGVNHGVFILQSAVFDRANRAVGYCQGDLVVIDLKAKKVVYHQNDQAYTQLEPPRLHSLDLSADGRWLVTTNSPGGARLVDLETGTIRLLTPPGSVYDNYRNLRISRDGRRTAIIHEEKMIRIWDLPSCKQIQTLDAGSYARALAFDPAGRCLVVGTDRGVQFWHAETGQRMAELNVAAGVSALQFSDDGRTLYAVSSDGSATSIYRLQIEPQGPVNTVAVATRD